MTDIIIIKITIEGANHNEPQGGGGDLISWGLPYQCLLCYDKLLIQLLPLI